MRGRWLHPWFWFSKLTGLCSGCKRSRHDDWPAENWGGLCQMCWEAECSRSWWKAIEEGRIV